MVREHNLKVDNNVNQSRLLYWQRLRLARQEYVDETGLAHFGIHTSSAVETDAFTEWMDNKYGIRLEFVDGNISGAYTITDEKKMMMFLLKYPG
jgi:hypothetical protein